jgi:polyphosphate kinase 2 (PPK2 family)
VLPIFQALDAAGKEVRLSMSCRHNPQGCQGFFRSSNNSSAEELDHDYPWRCVKCLPERGRIGIFLTAVITKNIAVRVHPAFLNAQKLPQKLVTDKTGTSVSGTSATLSVT